MKSLYKFMKSDNGCEFDNNAAHSFFLAQGIHLHLSCPIHPSKTARPNVSFSPPTISGAPYFFKHLCLLPTGSNPNAPTLIFLISTPPKLFKIELLINSSLAHLPLITTGKLKFPDGAITVREIKNTARKMQIQFS
jgi:hypothetical protein